MPAVPNKSVTVWWLQCVHLAVHLTVHLTVHLAVPSKYEAQAASGT